jgi:hypothetical protein
LHDGKWIQHVSEATGVKQNAKCEEEREKERKRECFENGCPCKYSDRSRCTRESSHDKQKIVSIHQLHRAWQTHHGDRLGNNDESKSKKKTKIKIKIKIGVHVNLFSYFSFVSAVRCSMAMAIVIVISIAKAANRERKKKKEDGDEQGTPGRRAVVFPINIFSSLSNAADLARRYVS